MLNAHSFTFYNTLFIRIRVMRVIDHFLSIMFSWVNRVHQTEFVLFMLLALPEVMLLEVLECLWVHLLLLPQLRLLVEIKSWRG